MAERVKDWRQVGRVFVWRYTTAGKARQGWHFTADPAGASSLTALLRAMRAAMGESHRTLRLSPVEEANWRVPSFGPPRRDGFTSLRIVYEPDFADLRMVADEDRLVLTAGAPRIETLADAFVDVGVGVGNFGVGTSDARQPEPWMFWWMPKGSREGR